MKYFIVNFIYHKILQHVQRKPKFSVNPMVLQCKQQKIMSRVDPMFLEEASELLLGRATLKMKSLSLPINSPREAPVPGITVQSPRG